MFSNADIEVDEKQVGTDGQEDLFIMTVVNEESVIDISEIS